MKSKSARAKVTKVTKPTKKSQPSDSVVIKFGVAFIVVAGFALLAYAVKAFLP